MRRSILTAVLASLIAVAVVGCDKDVIPTGPTPGARLNGPVEIGGEFLGIDPNVYVTIVAGAHHTCVRRNSNAIFCWGLDNLNQVGQESRTPCVSGLVCIATPTAVLNQSSDTLRVLEIDAGADHTCGLDGEGFGWCWGSGHSGQRSVGKGQTGQWPGAIVVDSLTAFKTLSQTSSMRFTSISAGGNSTCATTLKDGMFCWGILGWAIVGATGAGHTIPIQISPYSGYRSVTVGLRHACAFLDVGRNRSVDCWGSNGEGQLGIDLGIIPTTAAFTEPSQFGTAVNGVTTQSDFTCVDQMSGIVQCAGLNDFGQLGNGIFATRPDGNPQTVGGGQLLHDVTTGVTHACALDTKNAAWCWGRGDVGQLGNGVVGSQAVFNTPQPVSGGLTFRAIAAGKSHTCAIATDNGIYCWGSNRSGELGIQESGKETASTPMRAVDPRR